MSAGGDRSSQSSKTDTFIAPEQLPYLQNLWGMAQGAANPQTAVDAATGASQQVAPGLGQGFQSVAALTNPAGQVQAQTDSLTAGLRNLYQNEINPLITGNAIQAGQLGGGRQGVAQGVAAGELANAFTQGYGDIVSNANRTALAAGAALPGIGQAIGQNAMAPSMAAFGPLGSLAQILGSPTVLQKSRGESGSSGFSFGLS